MGIKVGIGHNKKEAALLRKAYMEKGELSVTVDNMGSSYDWDWFEIEIKEKDDDH